MNRYSIECSQPYSDNPLNHNATKAALEGLLKRIQREGATASLVALVDDTTHENPDYDFDNYARWLHTNGFEPDSVAHESAIRPASDQLLNAIDFTKLNSETASALQSENKYTSQLFIAAWCLLRLGYIEDNSFDKSLQAEKLVNVLPLSFKEGEEQSLDIIRATPFAEAVDKIEYIFVP